MKRYVIRRAIQSVFLLLAVSIISFTLMRIAPGGPVQFFEDPRVTPERVRQLQHQLGLDQPLPIQYLRWLWGIVRLDFGHSYVSRRPVLSLIVERLPATVLLSGTSLLLGFLGGIPLGIYAALKRGAWFDQAIRVITVAGNAIPHWWLALILIIVFSNNIPILPSGGMYTLGRDNLLDRLWHLILPAGMSAFGAWLTLSQFLRSEVLEVLRADYVTTARAKGLQERVVLTRHVLRNALIPVVTMMGGALAGLVSGAVLFEYVFSWPGMGRLTYEAFFKRDYPLLMALFMISSTLVIVGNLLADIAYSFVDPRVKLK
jgi:peptide/nickel transport system permease protein